MQELFCGHIIRHDRLGSLEHFGMNTRDRIYLDRFEKQLGSRMEEAWQLDQSISDMYFVKFPEGYVVYLV